MDGQGSHYKAVIIGQSRYEVNLEITDRHFEERDSSYPQLGFGIIKNTSRLEWLLEKVTEIGVHSITPIITARSEKKKLKLERLQKIIISASKQSKQYYVPELEEPCDLESYMSQHTAPLQLIASYAPSNPELGQITIHGTHPSILIGPEGDFTEGEVHHALHQGYQQVNLGDTRLRAETAAMVACTLLRN